jgi:hypothetical protein
VSSGLASSDERLAAAAYGLALRVTGDRERAVESVDSALARLEDGQVAFLNAVREQARPRRTAAPDPATAPRPPRLSSIPIADWAVLERVALRGMSVTEAADAVGIDRRETLLRLHRGLVAARGCLLDDRQAPDDADAVRLEGLGRDGAAGRLDDSTRDRQAEAGAASGIAA